MHIQQSMNSCSAVELQSNNIYYSKKCMHCSGPAVLMLPRRVITYPNWPVTGQAVTEADKALVPENTSETQQLKQKCCRMLWCYFNRGNLLSFCICAGMWKRIFWPGEQDWIQLASVLRQNPIFLFKIGDTIFSAALESGLFFSAGQHGCWAQVFFCHSNL